MIDQQLAQPRFVYRDGGLWPAEPDANPQNNDDDEDNPDRCGETS